jgi:hypothetical protein
MQMNMNLNLRTAQQNRHLHWLFGQLGVKDKDTIAEIVWDHTNHRTHHTSDLQFIEAMELIRNLENLRKNKRFSTSEKIDSLMENAPERVQLDRKRKGLIKAIFRWFELQGKMITMEYVKGVACRAAGVNKFNEISDAALTRLYAEFCRKQQAIESMQPDNFEISLN